MKYIPNTKQKNTKQGFSFIETLVAITVLLIAVVAPMSLAQDGIIAAKLSQDQIVAFYLGQEGIEVIKNLRDNNRLTNAPEQLFGPELSDCLVIDPNDPSEEGCIVDATRVSSGQFFTEECIIECEAIRLGEVGDARAYTYQLAGTTETKYVRTVKVWYPDGNPDEAAVRVTVTWPFGKAGIVKTYQVQNYLYNW